MGRNIMMLKRILGLLLLTILMSLIAPLAATSCTITIDSVVGTPPDPPSVTVTGTVTPPGECNNIEVTLKCPGGILVSGPIPVDAGGNWTATFGDTESITCLCKDFYIVEARCLDNPDCPESKTKGDELCPQECPEVIVNSHVCGDDEDENDGECCVNGKRLVILSSVHSGVGPLSVEWVYGGSCPDESFTLDGGIIDTKICYYDPGTYTATLHIDGCPDESTSFNVSECPPEIECPSISWDPDGMNCKDDGTQPITIKATLTGMAGTTISAELKEGATVLASGSAMGILELESTDDYASGSHTFTVDVTEPEGCPGGDLIFEVECEADGACCLLDGSCEELTEAECTSLDGDYKGDGTGCADFDCAFNGNGTDDDGCFFCWCGGFLCCLFWVLFIIALISTIITLAIALCSGTPGAWIAFGVSFALTITFGGLLFLLCDVNICTFLLFIAGSGFAGYGLVCGTNIFLPPNCTSWLCAMTNIPGIGGVANLLLIDIIFTILALIICALL